MYARIVAAAVEDRADHNCKFTVMMDGLAIITEIDLGVLLPAYAAYLAASFPWNPP